MTGSGQNDFKACLRDELAELDGRIGKLADFIGSRALSALPQVEQRRLRLQLGHMHSYRYVLAHRARAQGVEQ